MYVASSEIFLDQVIMPRYSTTENWVVDSLVWDAGLFLKGNTLAGGGGYIMVSGNPTISYAIYSYFI